MYETLEFHLNQFGFPQKYLFFCFGNAHVLLCSIQLKNIMKSFFVFIEHIKVSEYFIHNNMYSQIQKELLMVDPCKMYEVAAM
jgi:hypothetical protein